MVKRSCGRLLKSTESIWTSMPNANNPNNLSNEDIDSVINEKSVVSANTSLNELDAAICC